MRIIAGELKGRKIIFPEKNNTRPLRDLVKESIFNILQHSVDNKVNLFNSNVLDLFSGTGSFGLECLSRGARKVTFFENHLNSIKILEKNINFLNLEDKSEIIKSNVYNLENDLSKDKFDLIFIDPPFRDEKLNNLLKKLNTSKFVRPNTIVIIHRNKKIKEIIDSKFNISREKVFGLSKILFGRIDR